MFVSKQVPIVYEFGPFRLDPAAGVLFSNGKPVSLEPKVFQTLAILVRNNGRLVEKAELMSEIWPDSFVEETNLTRNISILRKILGKTEDRYRYIETLPKRGYRFAGTITQTESLDPDTALRPASAQPDSCAVAEQIAAWKPPSTTAGSAAEHQARSGLVLLPDSSIGGIQHSSSLRRNLTLGAIALAIGLATLAATLYLMKIRSRRVAASTGVRSIAVLPFKPEGVDPGEEYLGLSLTDALITDLGPVARISIRPTSAVRRYQGESRAPAEIGRELEVQMILAGQFQKRNGQVEVTAQLINSKDGSSLWSGRFQEAPDNLFNLESAITQRVVAALDLPADGAGNQRPPTHSSNSGEAYQHYLRGRFLWDRRNAEDTVNAEAEFERAIQLDPNYAQPYAGLADCYLLLPHPGVNQPDMALKALQLDDTLAEAHASLAYRESALDWNWTEAEREFQRAITLNPSYVTAHHWYAYHLASMGRLEEALSEISKAQQLDPLSSIINTDVGQILYFSRRYDEAIAKYLKVLEVDPKFGVAHQRLAEAYNQKQLHNEAIAEFQTAFSLDSARYNPDYAGILGYSYAMAGKRDEALKIAEKLKPVAEVRDRYADLALVYVGLDWKDLAFECLDKSVKAHEGFLALLQVEPMFDNLRSDPRYIELLRRMNLLT